MLSLAFLDELRARTTLSALVGQTVKLQKAGREWKAPCPFHKEKTPSFYVNDEKSFYHCFGCGVHGDAIRWLTDARGLPFMDAVKELADAAGIQVPAPDPRAKAAEERREPLFQALSRAASFFASHRDCRAAATYLERRHVPAAVAAAFGLGFAPDGGQELRRALSGAGDEDLIAAGLLVRPDDGREPYDKFRARLMFPIRDQRGRVIGFTGRLLREGEPKYLNSPDTELYDKGRTLFNLDRAGAAARAAGRLILVEGQMDVVGLAAVGIDEAVAPNGTAVTEAQLGLMWRMSPSPILCFDGDAAGRKAAARAAARALSLIGPDRSLSFASLPPGKDPDDIRREGGRDAIEAVLLVAEPLVDFLWRHELAAEPTRTPEQRAGLKKRLTDLCASIADRDVRDQYQSEFARRFAEAFPTSQDRTHAERKPSPVADRQGAGSEPGREARDSHDGGRGRRLAERSVLRARPGNRPSRLSGGAAQVPRAPLPVEPRRLARPEARPAK